MPVPVKNDSHQFGAIATCDFDYSQLPATGVFTRAFDLPAGAVVLSGELKVLTAFNPGTSLTAAFGTAATPGKYLAATTVAVAATTAMIAPNALLAVREPVGVTFTLVGAAPTAGRMIAYVRYLVLGKQHETVG